MITTHIGDCRDVLPTLEEQSVQCIVTSPPYYGLRDYGVAGQIGAEAIPDCLAWARGEPPCGACYVCNIRAVSALLWRVLRNDGVYWLNLGDSYAGGRQGRADQGMTNDHRSRPNDQYLGYNVKNTNAGPTRRAPPGYKDKSLLLIPPRVALALQSDGWIVRSRIAWVKDNPIPESVRDRPTRSHEDIYLLAKQASYYYDQEAVAEAALQPVGIASQVAQHKRSQLQSMETSTLGTNHGSTTRNLRDVWRINPQNYSGNHFAVYPIAIPNKCIRASSRPGDMVLDPFGGTGTTALAAIALRRSCTLIELRADYINLQPKRMNGLKPT